MEASSSGCPMIPSWKLSISPHYFLLYWGIWIVSLVLRGHTGVQLLLSRYGLCKLHQSFEPLVASVWVFPVLGFTCFIATLGSSLRNTRLATSSLLSVKVSPIYSQRTSGCPRKASHCDSIVSFVISLYSFVSCCTGKLNLGTIK